MIGLLAIAAALPLSWCGQDPGSPAPRVTVGSKKFTESVLLGEIAVRLLEDAGMETRHRRELGGTRILWNALLAGEIDVYAEYTGTLLHEILADESLAGEDLAAALEARGLRASRPLGFENSYALGMRAAQARELGVASIGDLRAHPGLRFGFGNEFLDREDGWPALRAAYRLPQESVGGLDHDLAYRALDAGDIDVMDLYTTDAEIVHYDLLPLTDDRGHFPRYEAVWIWRADLVDRAPGAVAALRRLEGRLDSGTMRAMNARVKLDRDPDAQVAAEYLAAELGLAGEWTLEPLAARLLQRTLEHLLLVAAALAAAVLAAVPLGVLAARRPRAGQVVLALAGVMQTVPSLALLALLIPMLGIGALPAIVALFLYGLLPIVRNTHAGLVGVPAELRESAEAIGMSARARLLRIDLPLASPSILAGIQTSAVIAVGVATLGALIDSGGYGQPILTGIRLDDTALILEGALPAAAMAIAVQILFGLLERVLVPRGIRLAAVR
ncbi:MAG TPA: glycine betaine ABC transporter substrate-binding protein [Planctomycetota bacterium]